MSFNGLSVASYPPCVVSPETVTFLTYAFLILILFSKICFWAFWPLMTGQSEVWQGREGMTCSKGPWAGIELAAAAAKTLPLYMQCKLYPVSQWWLCLILALLDYTNWRILVIGRMDLKLFKKCPGQMLAAAPAPAVPNSHRETQILNRKLLYSAFLPLEITWSVCFGEEKTSADNLAQSNNPWILALKLSEKKHEHIIAGAGLVVPPWQTEQHWSNIDF